MWKSGVRGDVLICQLGAAMSGIVVDVVLVRRRHGVSDAPLVLCRSPLSADIARVACGQQVRKHGLCKTVWPSGLRRWLKAPVRKGVGSNPTAVIH